MAKLIDVAVYETSRYSSKYDYYKKAKNYFEENNIPYTNRTAFKTTGENVLETKITMKEVKKMAKALDMEYNVIF